MTGKWEGRVDGQVANFNSFILTKHNAKFTKLRSSYRIQYIRAIIAQNR